MACAKPVIAADDSSLPEVVEDGLSGVLYPPDDIDAIVAVCRALAAGPQTCRQNGRAARARTEAMFYEDLVVPRYVALYRRLSEH